MNPNDVTRHLADLLTTCGHPAIRSVQLLDNGTLKVVFGDQSEIYTKVAHISPATAAAPGRPSWPAPPKVEPEDPRIVNTDPAATGMRPDYFAHLAQHLMRTAKPSQVAAVTTYAEAGITGDAWAPYGLRVQLGTGQAAYLTVVRGSAPLGDDKAMPEVFTEEDLRVPALRS